MEERIYNLVADILGKSVDELKEVTDEKGVWDSLKRAEIVFALEDEFDILFEPDEIVYMDTINNEVMKAKIVIPSHANKNYNKYSDFEMKDLIGHKKDDIVCIDFSTSYFIRILDVINKEEKPTLH